MFPRVIFRVWFWIRVGQKRYLHKILGTKLSSSPFCALEMSVDTDSLYILLLTCWLTFSAWGSTQGCSTQACSSSRSYWIYSTLQGQVWVQSHRWRCQLLQVAHVIKIIITDSHGFQSALTLSYFMSCFIYFPPAAVTSRTKSPKVNN